MALGFGTVVGWSWVMMAGEWVAAAGFGGAIVAFCICAGVFLLLALLYGELASALPLAGGEFVYVYRCLLYTSGYGQNSEGELRLYHGNLVPEPVF